MLDLCSASVAEAKPASVIESLVMTVNGSAELKVVRAMRLPVTTISFRREDVDALVCNSQMSAPVASMHSWRVALSGVVGDTAVVGWLVCAVAIEATVRPVRQVAAQRATLVKDLVMLRPCSFDARRLTVAPDDGSDIL
jgi:hypothetical protein